jgi:hypothetical protein
LEHCSCPYHTLRALANLVVALLSHLPTTTTSWGVASHAAIRLIRCALPNVLFATCSIAFCDSFSTNIRTSISHYICLITAQYQLDSSCTCMYTHTRALWLRHHSIHDHIFWSLSQYIRSWISVALQNFNVCNACVAVHTLCTQTLLSNIFAIAAEFVFEFHFKTLHNRTSCSSCIQIRQVASLHSPMPRATASFASTASGEGLQVPAALSALGSAGQALHQSPSGSYVPGNHSAAADSPSCETSPGATPALGSPSARYLHAPLHQLSSILLVTEGCHCTTPPHITAQAMTPPSAITTASAVPLTTLQYSECLCFHSLLHLNSLVQAYQQVRNIIFSLLAVAH